MAGAGNRWRVPHEGDRLIRPRVEYLLAAVIVAAAFALAFAGNAHGAVRWHTAGASFFGGPTDSSSGCTGYRGDNLCTPWKWRSFAELQMGSALGGLPYGARIRVLYRGRKLTVVKRDVGLGGGSVGGWPRSIDLWHSAAAYLRVPGLAVVRWRRVQ